MSLKSQKQVQEPKIMNQDSYTRILSEKYEAQII